MKFSNILVASIITIILISVVAWLIREKNLQMERHFAPLEEEVRHDTFENSSAYQHGMIQELQQMQISYIENASNPEGQEAIADIILHRVASFEGKLPQDLHNFVQMLKRKRGM